MTALTYLLQLSLPLLLIFASACVDLPLEFTLRKPIIFKESRIKKIVSEVRQHLTKLDLGPDGTMPGKKIDAQKCNQAFVSWLDKQFANGLIPKRLITPLEYARNNQNPLFSQCKNVDLSIEFNASVRKVIAAQLGPQEGVHFRAEEFRSALASEECRKRFIDPEKEKIIIKGIRLWVKRNTLNIHAPTYNLYYATKDIPDSEFKGADAEKKLVETGQMVHFAKSTRFAPRFEGVIGLSYLGDFAKKEAKFPGLEADIIALPELIFTEPETTVIADQEYFIVPKGELAFYLTIDISLKAELSDALCALRVYKEEQKEKDEARRRAFDEAN